jgi:hypothetical protein
MPDADPQNHVDQFTGRQCSFDGPDGKRLSGTVLKQEWIGYTTRGNLPNWILMVQGSSGRTREVDLVEQHVSIK